MDDQLPAPPPRGIHARTVFPSPIYDGFFTVRRLPDGTCICIERAAKRGADRHYWERVPCP